MYNLVHFDSKLRARNVTVMAHVSKLYIDFDKNLKYIRIDGKKDSSGQGYII